jgi:hypothetical protein
MAGHPDDGVPQLERGPCTDLRFWRAGIDLDGGKVSRPAYILTRTTASGDRQGGDVGKIYIARSGAQVTY